MRRVPGHELLARIGKKTLRPGGKVATEWLIERAGISKNSNVLEVACNMGTTLIDVASKYGANIVGVDMSENALKTAASNIRDAGFEDAIELVKADARNLPFEDECFDVVINEAMLTMLSNEDKKKAIGEYFRVLKNGGVLLTHDVNLPNEDPELIGALRKVINIPATPLSEDHWVQLFKNVGFDHCEIKTGRMAFMSEEGLVRDEGFEGMMRIYENASKDPNYEQFLEMKKFFMENEDKFCYIALVSRK
ncbi:MAG: SAM-dependent methyltransferase [Dethiosulfovibrio peptidovorans]|nr:MAG: SAM-dependent methyltransferase [Dethiosulfovibrio peptidovorans]